MEGVRKDEVENDFDDDIEDENDYEVGKVVETKRKTTDDGNARNKCCKLIKMCRG